MELNRNYGMAWGVGGWLVTPFLQKIGPAGTQRLKERVASELKTTFASRYAGEVSLREALDLENIAVYGKTATGTEIPDQPEQGCLNRDAALCKVASPGFSIGAAAALREPPADP